MRPIKADDEDEFWEDEPAPEGHPGTVADVSSSSGLGDALLSLIGELTKVAVILHELPEDEFKLIGGRLAAMKGLVASLPEGGRPGKKIGFKVRRGQKAKNARASRSQSKRVRR